MDGRVGMCTVVVLRRPGHDWPLLLAANRDEMADRPWKPPGRHWPDRADVAGGLDVLAGGTWMAMNDDQVVACVLNRLNTLGPDPRLRSRGELPLEAVDHAEARDAVDALADLDPAAYRPFNMVIADARHAYWLCSRGAEEGAAAVEVHPLPAGLSMVTAYDRNDSASPRMHMYLPLFEAAEVPDPDAGDWSAWEALLAARAHDPEAGPGGAMTVVTDTGFGTVSGSLVALPSLARWPEPPVWLFAAGRPGEAPYRPVGA